MYRVLPNTEVGEPSTKSFLFVTNNAWKVRQMQITDASFSLSNFRTFLENGKLKEISNISREKTLSILQWPRKVHDVKIHPSCEKERNHYVLKESYTTCTIIVLMYLM